MFTLKRYQKMLPLRFLLFVSLMTLLACTQTQTGFDWSRLPYSQGTGATIEDCDQGVSTCSLNTVGGHSAGGHGHR